jgi:hypothetical protein
MSDDSALQQPGLEEAEGEAEGEAHVEAQAEAQQHPWLTLRWRQHMERTAVRLLHLAAQQGCPATAGWLLQLLEDLGVQVQEALCQVGESCLPYIKSAPWSSSSGLVGLPSAAGVPTEDSSQPRP